MEGRELMIGDWVYNTHNRKPEQVCEVRERMVMLDYYDLYEYDEIEPIKLTSVLLTANGFYSEQNIGYVYEDGEYEVIVDLWNNGYRILYNRDVVVSIHCFSDIAVHELQHALRLCGINKNISI